MHLLQRRTRRCSIWNTSPVSDDPQARQLFMAARFFATRLMVPATERHHDAARNALSLLCEAHNGEGVSFLPALQPQKGVVPVGRGDKQSLALRVHDRLAFRPFATRG